MALRKLHRCKTDFPGRSCSLAPWLALRFLLCGTFSDCRPTLVCMVQHHAPQFGYVPPPQQEDALESKLTSRWATLLQQQPSATLCLAE